MFHQAEAFTSTQGPDEDDNPGDPFNAYTCVRVQWAAVCSSVLKVWVGLNRACGHVLSPRLLSCVGVCRTEKSSIAPPAGAYFDDDGDQVLALDAQIGVWGSSWAGHRGRASRHRPNFRRQNPTRTKVGNTTISE